MHLGLCFVHGASLFHFQRVNFHGAVEVLPFAAPQVKFKLFPRAHKARHDLVLALSNEEHINSSSLFITECEPIVWVCQFFNEHLGCFASKAAEGIHAKVLYRYVISFLGAKYILVGCLGSYNSTCLTF